MPEYNEVDENEVDENGSNSAEPVSSTVDEAASMEVMLSSDDEYQSAHSQACTDISFSLMLNTIIGCGQIIVFNSQNLLKIKIFNIN